MSISPHEAAYGAYLNYLHFGEATLTFPQTLILRYGRFEADDRKSPQVVDDYSRWFFARLKSIESVLTSSQFLCGSQFTAADISVGYALMLADYLELSGSFRPATANYWHRLKERPAFLRAICAQERSAIEQQVPTTPAPKT